MAAIDVVIPSTGETVYGRRPAGRAAVDNIDALGIDEVKVRTPLTCETRYGLCASAMAVIWRGKLVNTGVAKPWASSLPSRLVSRAPS